MEPARGAPRDRVTWPRALDRRTIAGRVILDRVVVQSATSNANLGGPSWLASARRPSATAVCWRCRCSEGRAIGAIRVTRSEARPFSEKQIDAARTFADQAVIAIENVRLFQELETRNRELTESLEQQTATSDILRVISSSPTDIQPVFDTMAESAARLWAADDVVVRRVEDEHPRHGGAPQARFPRCGNRSTAGPFPSASGVTLTARPFMIARRRGDPEYRVPGALPENRAQRLSGSATVLAVPLCARVAIGVIAIATPRGAARSPTTQIELLKTFADQAVIAIENVRLFKELEATGTAS